ncbi:hypothetical protein [Palleronia pelagia]|uniref:hypothetical protein n=1 Tax=Palleronia pelagia TaxID=387096 RepID=UPI001587E46D|nr:hypothetical protein [Palleronia pelagia]
MTDLSTHILGQLMAGHSACDARVDGVAAAHALDNSAGGDIDDATNRKLLGIDT